MPTPAKGYYLAGERLPGTTTVISRFKDSGGLLYWAFEQGKLAQQGKIAKLYDKAEEAAEIGTAAHSMIEAMINGDDPYSVSDFQALTDNDKEKASNAYDQYCGWEKQTGLKMISKFQEIQLVSPEFKFGGTPDALAKINGKIVLLDWKTSNGIYPDYIVQLAAYRHLINEGVRMDTGKPLDIKVDNEAHLLRFAKEYPDFGHHYFGDLDVGWEQFKLFRSAYENDKVLKKRAA